MADKSWEPRGKLRQTDSYYRSGIVSRLQSTHVFSLTIRLMIKRISGFL